MMRLRDLRERIDFRRSKYRIPLFAYVVLLVVGGLVIRIANTGPVEKEDTRRTTDYFNTDMADAAVDTTLVSKEDAMNGRYRGLEDNTAVAGVSDDRDSLNKKEEYDTQYSGDELDEVRRQQAERKQQEQLRQAQARQREMEAVDRQRRRTSDDYVATVSNGELARADRRRRQREMDQLSRDLDEGYNSAVAASRQQRSNAGGVSPADGIVSQENGGNVYGRGVADGGTRQSSDRAADGGEPAAPAEVRKKDDSPSRYFNTIGESEDNSALITAIIDENIKAVDGSRVRLRLLDDIEIEGTAVPKGTYLYATMSGFGSQRVQGSVQNVLVGDRIVSVSLTIYDTDGLPGLYVPASKFREAAREIAGSAADGSNNLTDESSYGTGGVRQWASQAARNATQKVMSTVSGLVRRNRVKLKYGTRVYLVSGGGRSSR